MNDKSIFFLGLRKDLTLSYDDCASIYSSYFFFSFFLSSQMYSAVYGLFILMITAVFGQQHVFQHTNRLMPFTLEWTEILQQMYNTMGNKSREACLFPVPSFNCEPFYWNDQIIHRDAYHLRPKVKKQRL